MRASDRRVRREFASGFMVVECAANRQPPGDRTHSDCKFVRFFSLCIWILCQIYHNHIYAPPPAIFNTNNLTCLKASARKHCAWRTEQRRWRVGLSKYAVDHVLSGAHTHTRCTSSTHHLYACRRTERGISTDAQCAKQSSRSTHLTQDGPLTRPPQNRGRRPRRPNQAKRVHSRWQCANKPREHTHTHTNALFVSLSAFFSRILCARTI